MRVFSSALLGLVTCSFIAGCDLPGADTPTKQGKFQVVQSAPTDAAPGTCWGKSETAAIIETVEREVLVRPARVSPDGRIQQPAVYKKESRQEIVQEREVIWKEIVCVTRLTEDFTASLQRALAVRGYYRGPVTGLMDNRTRRAIRKFQAEDGFDNAILTIAAARKLGLVAVPRS